MATAARRVNLSIGLVGAVVKLEGIREGSSREATQFKEGHACSEKKFTLLTRKRMCPECDVEVAYEDITKLRPMDSGFVPFGKDEVTEMKEAALVSVKGQIPLTPHPAASVNAKIQPAGAAYYAYPDEGCSLQAYSAIYQAVQEQTEVSFCSIFSVRKGTEYMARAEIINGALGVRVYMWPDEVSAPRRIDIETSERASKLMNTIVEGLITDFNPEEYTNNFKGVLAEVEKSRVPGEGGFPLAALPKQKKNSESDFFGMLESYAATVAPKGKKAKSSG